MNDVVIEVTDPDTLLAESRAAARRDRAAARARSSSSTGSPIRTSLIDLPNRRGFMRQLEALIDRVSRYDDSAAMLFVDIDGLKMINDTFGHKAGDEALIQVAEHAVRAAFARATAWRGSAATSSGSCSSAPTRRAPRRPRRGWSIDDRRLRILLRGHLPAAERRDRRSAMIEPDDHAEAVMARADEAMYRQKAAA